jgi:hypothetical protein
MGKTRSEVMSKATDKLLVAAVCTAMALPMVTRADDYGHTARPPSYHQGNWNTAAPPSSRGGQHYDHDGGSQGHYSGGPYPYYAGQGQRYYNGGAYRYYNYGAYQPYYYAGPRYYYGGYQPYYYGHNHHSDNDDALWAVGGLVLGAIIGSAVEHASAHPAAPASAPPPPAGQPQNCDRVEYDSAGNPYVERSCNK